MSGGVELYFRTSQRLLVLTLGDGRDRLFRVDLPAKPDPDAVEYRCTYQLQTGSRWTPQTATLTLSEHEWVWMDGATPCDTGDDPSLN